MLKTKNNLVKLNNQDKKLLKKLQAKQKRLQKHFDDLNKKDFFSYIVYKEALITQKEIKLIQKQIEEIKKRIEERNSNDEMQM